MKSILNIIKMYGTATNIPALSLFNVPIELREFSRNEN
jgi:hypothetical protein